MMKRLKILTVVAAVLAVAYFTREQYLPAVAHWLDIGGPPAHADYVIALPGGAQTRPFVAAALFNAGLAREVIVVQLMLYPENLDGDDLPDHEITRRVFQRRGVPAEKIHMLDSRSDSTFQDAEAVARFLAKHDSSTVTIVTSNYHSRRARWVFAQVFRGTKHRLQWFSAPDYEFDPDNWWKTADGLSICLSEYAKFAYYHARYAPVWTLLWCAGPVAVVAWAIRCRRRRRIKLASNARSFNPEPSATA